MTNQKKVPVLLQAGYSLLTIDETGKTALHYGARFGHKEILRFLIAKAPERALDMVDGEKGQAALHKAAAYKRRTICCMLVAAGASLLIKVQADPGVGVVSRNLFTKTFCAKLPLISHHNSPVSTTLLTD